MWIRRSFLKNIGKAATKASKTPNIDQEYLCALKARSCADFFTIDEGQEAIAKLILDSPLLSSKPELKSLINNYFDASAEASRICSHLLKSVNQIQSTHQAMQFSDNLKLIVSELNSLANLENPLSSPQVPTKNEFKLITEKQSSLLIRLKQKTRKLAMKIKLSRCFNRATMACLVLGFGAATSVAIFLAVHTLLALLMGPALFTLPYKKLQKTAIKGKGSYSYCIEFIRTEMLGRLRGQLDLAAKGTYVLNRDFDTLSRSVQRLHDEVERNKAMARFCLDRRGYRFESVKEEIKNSQSGLKKQAEELEEHLCLCLVNIVRTRDLVIREILPSA